MIRGFVYSSAVLVGCTAGVVLGFVAARDSLETVASSILPSDIGMPRHLTQEGTVTYVDIQHRLVTFDMVSPYNPDTRLAVRAAYADTTSFLDQFGAPLELSDFHQDDRVSVTIARKVGTFNIVRISKL